jgi:hypothetical protein
MFVVVLHPCFCLACTRSAAHTLLGPGTPLDPLPLAHLSHTPVTRGASTSNTPAATAAVLEVAVGGTCNAVGLWYTLSSAGGRHTCSNQPATCVIPAAGGRDSFVTQEQHQAVTVQAQQQPLQSERSMAAEGGGVAQGHSQLLQGVMYLDGSASLAAGTQVGMGCCHCSAHFLPATCPAVM